MARLALERVITFERAIQAYRGTDTEVCVLRALAHELERAGLDEGLL